MWPVIEPDDDRQALHGLEDSLEVLTLEGQQPGELVTTLLLCVGEDHLLDDGQSNT